VAMKSFAGAGAGQSSPLRVKSIWWASLWKTAHEGSNRCAQTSDGYNLTEPLQFSAHPRAWLQGKLHWQRTKAEALTPSWTVASMCLRCHHAIGTRFVPDDQANMRQIGTREHLAYRVGQSERFRLGAPAENIERTVHASKGCRTMQLVG